MNKKNDMPPCFGDLERVFPMTDKGLRQTPDECFYHCPIKTRCLQQAMATRAGGQVEEEILERGTRSGAISFFERWSRKKQMARKMTD
ncbi:hypothetical protein [Desulfobacula sp.]|uniref:hypothetical protein n=1 Tax=Desulfobacula sp. TaxID=2593537 RepID=UPI002628D667|nr:hypothetical protein [Desulfobacula sp.]